jgi:hypothetical protein
MLIAGASLLRTARCHKTNASQSSCNRISHTSHFPAHRNSSIHSFRRASKRAMWYCESRGGSIQFSDSPSTRSRCMGQSRPGHNPRGKVRQKIEGGVPWVRIPALQPSCILPVKIRALCRSVADNAIIPVRTQTRMT